MNRNSFSNIGLRMASRVILGASILFASSVLAEDAIDTDGPDFVESSEVVPKGRFQYEVDVMAVRDRRVPSTSPALGTPALLKYGIAENVELRVAPAGYVRQNGAAGGGDTAFGLKWHTQDRDAAANTPAVSWIFHVDAPTGSGPFRGRGTRPSLRSVITWDLPNDFAFGIMPGLKRDIREDGRRFNSAIFGAVLNKRLNDHVRLFVEAAAAQIARSRDGGMQATWDVGAAYLVNLDVQIGARAGIAANRNTPDSYLLFELAQRF